MEQYKNDRKIFFIVAWLPEDSVKRVVMDSTGTEVLHFDTYDKAWDFFVDNMTPDWECVVVPMRVVEMHTMEEAEDGLKKV